MDTSRRLRLLLIAALITAGCQCTPLGVDQARFRCTSDEDCRDGFSCQPVDEHRECVAGRVDGGTGGGGTGGGGTGGGGTGGGGATGNQLAFVSAPPVAYVARCSRPLVVQVRDSTGQAKTVTSPVTVLLSSSASGVSFFAGASCQGTATMQTVIPAGSDSSTISVLVPASGTVPLQADATAAGLTVATLMLDVQGAPDALVFVTPTANQACLMRSCLPSTVGLRSGNTPVVADAELLVSLSAQGQARFYADPSCSVEVMAAPIAAGSASTSFFVQPLEPVAMTLQGAAAQLTSATVALQPRPWARRNTCIFSTVAGQEKTMNCPIGSPVVDLSQALLLVQTAAYSPGPSAYQVRCRLADAATVQCDRLNTQPATVHWQVLELPEGLSVQALTQNTMSSAVIPLPRPVDPAHSFVLKTISTAGNYFGDEDTATFELDGGSELLMEPAHPVYDVQVVEWSGVTVLHDVLPGGIPTGSLSASAMGLTPVSTNAALLSQPHLVSGDSASPMCALMARGEMTSSSSVQFTRGLGNVSCRGVPLDRILFDRLDFGSVATVQAVTTTLPAGMTIPRDVTLSRPVDLNRTIVFASSQLSGGQGTGETDIDAGQLPNAWPIGPAAFLLQLIDANTVRVERRRADAAGSVTFYVVEVQ